MAPIPNDRGPNYDEAGVATYCAATARHAYRRQSPLLPRDIVTMPWDLDRLYGRLPDLLKERKDTEMKTERSLSLPRIFTVCLDVFILILERISKQDAFRLALTCKSFLRNPAILRAIFREPITMREMKQWYLTLRTDVEMTGPPVTWGINRYTGPFVRRLTLPVWTSAYDIKYLAAHCPKLDSVDFSQIFVSVPFVESDLDLGDWSRYFGLRFSMLDYYVTQFRNLRCVRLPYGYWTHVVSRSHNIQQTCVIRLPNFVFLANLKSLELCCGQVPESNSSPESRRKSAARLLLEIKHKVPMEFTTLALSNSVSTIDNIDSFMQSLAIFPKLRTVKLSLHHDLYNYQRIPHSSRGFNRVLDPIISSTNQDYAHDTATVLQYLSNVKKIMDRGHFSIMSSDSGENYRSRPSEYYGLSQTELVLGPRNDLWSPVWEWNDRLSWVKCHQDDGSIEAIDIGRCRALFEELIKARIPVSLSLVSRAKSAGALFARPWDDTTSRFLRHYGTKRNKDHGYHAPSLGVIVEVTANSDAAQQPKQQSIQRRIWTTTRLKMLPRLKGRRRARMMANPVVRRLSYVDYKDYTVFDPPVLAARGLPKQMVLEKEQVGKIIRNNAKPEIFQKTPQSGIPDPIWRLNEIGDLVDDLRLTWDRNFAYVYAWEFAKDCDEDPDRSRWSKLMHHCYVRLRDRLYREAEHTALLFRRIPVDFPRLTRLALFIPVALYPDHDQTFINRVLPGTGWTVKHHGYKQPCCHRHEPCLKLEKFSSTLVANSLPCAHENQFRLKLADDMCPFIQRVFTRPAPTEDPSEVIVHNDERHITRRPLFDLDGEYKSMEQLLTEPLWKNYTVQWGEDGLAVDGG